MQIAALVPATYKVEDMDVEGVGLENVGHSGIFPKTSELLGVDGRDNSLNAIRQAHPASDLVPVSFIGWGLALICGALIWAVALYFLVV